MSILQKKALDKHLTVTSMICTRTAALAESILNSCKNNFQLTFVALQTADITTVDHNALHRGQWRQPPSHNQLFTRPTIFQLNGLEDDKRRPLISH